MGTSITAGFHGPGSYLSPYIVGERLNLLPINAGFDGASAAPCNRKYWDDFCLARLVQAINARNWSAQDSSIGFMNAANKLSLSNLKATRFGEVTYLGLEYGVNDFTLSVPVDIFLESIRTAAKILLSDFPKIRLFTIGPTWNPNAARQNDAGVQLVDYSGAMADVSHDLGIPFLDMMTELALNDANVSFFTFDGTHPNETGARVRGEMTASFILKVFWADTNRARTQDRKDVESIALNFFLVLAGMDSVEIGNAINAEHHGLSVDDGWLKRRPRRRTQRADARVFLMRNELPRIWRMVPRVALAGSRLGPVYL
jgi:lysophospholipase L1-like esterase